MSTQIAEQERVPNGQPVRARLLVQDDSPISHLMDTAKFEHLQRIAGILGDSAMTPAHLKGKTERETIANCFRVVNQAFRWGFDPFAVADETYVVSGKLGYQGKLVAAVIHTRAGLDGRLKQVYEGQGEKLSLTISGRFRGESETREVTITLAQAKTQNKMWVTDPEQKLWYSGVIKWARRHCPEVIMGVLTEEDIERIQEMSPQDEPKLVSESPPGPGRQSLKKPASTTTQQPAAPTTTEQQPSTPVLDEMQVQDLWNDLHVSSTPLDLESAIEAVMRNRTWLRRPDLSRLEAKIAEMRKTIK